MEVNEAVSRISEIHAHLLKSELFRGYRPWPTAMTGAIAGIAAAVQATVLPAANAHEFALFWLVGGAACASLCFGDVARNYLRASPGERRRTLVALGQFAPTVVVGVIVSAMLIDRGPQYLPGLWSLLYALGLFSSRLHLPRSVGWVGLWFLATGTLLAVSGDAWRTPWSMGISFGCGQVALAAVFLHSIERSDRGHA